MARTTQPKQKLNPLLRISKYFWTLPAFYTLSAIVWLTATSNVMRSSWVGDDWPNSQTPYWVFWRYGDLSPANVFSEAQYWNNQWMLGQGRFYFIHWLESRFAFSYLRSLWSYKLVETGCLFLAGILFILLIYKLSKSHTLAIFTLFSLSVTMQFRKDFDPHIAFAFMVPSLMIKVFVAGILAYYASVAKNNLKGYTLSCLAGFSLLLAISTYEYAFLMFPVILIAFVIGIIQFSNPDPNVSFFRFLVKSLKTRLMFRFIPIFITWIAYAIFVFGYLRVNASAISGVYVLGFSKTSLSTFITQLFPAWPLTVFQFSDFEGLAYKEIALLASISVFATLILIMFLARIFPAKDMRSINKNSNWNRVLPLLILLAVDLVAAPGFMLSLQREWWGRTSFTRGYLGILIQEFGTALIISIFLNSLTQKNLRLKKSTRDPRSSRE